MRRLLRRGAPLLSNPQTPIAILLLALLLTSPSLGVGLMGDDFMQLARVDPEIRAPGFAHAPLDLFVFSSGQASQRAVLLEEGVFGWWLAPDFRMAFWRPLSSLTHAVDFVLWRHSAALAHAHSLLWFAILLLVLAALYRRFQVPWIATLALLLYAIDDAHGWAVAWIANRNAFVAAAPAFLALLVHDRARREGWAPGRWLGPLLFGLSLLGGEAALALGGYLLAHVLFIDAGPLLRRLTRLWPYAVLAFSWLAAYKLLGYGTAGGGMYLNPLDEPLLYLAALLERLPVLLAAQLGLGIADVWLVLPVAARAVAFALALVLLLAFAILLAPLLRRSPVCQFWSLGAVLSLPVVCATYPMERLLVFPGVGAMAVVALVLAEWLEPDGLLAAPRARRVLATVALPALVVAHLLLAPLLLPLRVYAVGLMARMGATLEASMPRGEDVRGKRLVILSSAAEFTTFPPWMQRQVSGAPRPRSMRVLASCFGALSVTRIDPRTLRVRPAAGFLDNPFLQVVRGPSRPFQSGDAVDLPELRVLVREVTPDGRPAEADFVFTTPLEDASLLWTRLKAGGVLIPWSPPAAGQTMMLPAIAP